MSRVPQHYVPKHLSKKEKRQQKKELAKSRKAYKKGKYHTRKRVKGFKSKRSKHENKVRKMYKFKNNEKITIKKLSKKTHCSSKSLNGIVKKGMGAYYSSGSRPNQTAHSWGYARLYSAITGGPAAKYDKHLLDEGCSKKSKALKLAKNPRKNTPRKKVQLGGDGKWVEKVDIKDDDCLICLDSLKNPEKLPVYAFEPCGHQFHNSCIVEYCENPVNRDKAANDELTCPKCRAPNSPDVNDCMSTWAYDNKALGDEAPVVLNSSDYVGGKSKTRKKSGGYKMKEKIIRFEKSPISGKKYRAFVRDYKTKKVRHIDFGASDYQQYKDRVPLKLYAHKNHGTRKRMRNYFNRHSGTPIRSKAIEKERKKSKGYYNAKILSHEYLW